MEKYYVIIAQDDNSIYRVEGFSSKRYAKDCAIKWCDFAYVVALVSGDCMKYSDNAMVKNARKKIKGE